MEEKSELLSEKSLASSKYNGILFDQAVTSTTWSGPGWRSCWVFACIFQLLAVILLCLADVSISPVIYGIGFLEKEPKHFECQEDGEWKDCDKEYICENQLSKDQYKPVVDDQVLDNWVDKFDLLCEPWYKVGLIGSMFFLGVVVSVTFVGLLADQYGRKWPFIISLML